MGRPSQGPGAQDFAGPFSPFLRRFRIMAGPMKDTYVTALLKTELVHNSVEAYISAGWTFIVVLAVTWALRRLVISRLRAHADAVSAETNRFTIGLLGQVRFVELILLA